MSTVSPYATKTVSRNWVGAFFEGVSVPLVGYRFMREHKELWRFGWIPVLLNLVISIAMGFVLFEASGALWTYVVPFFPEGILGWFLKAIAFLAVAVVSIGLVIGLWFLLSAIFCGIFYSKLAREIEKKLGTPSASLKEVPLWYEISYALRTAGLLLATNLGLLFLHLIPMIGSALSGGLSFYFDCYLFGWEYFDYPLALRGRRYEQKRSFIKQNRFHTVGMGAAVMVFTFVPVLGPIFLTTAVAGGVLLFHRIENSQ